MGKYWVPILLVAGSWVVLATTPKPSVAPKPVESKPSVAPKPAEKATPKEKANSCETIIFGTDSMMYMDAATGGKKVDKIVVPATCTTYTIDFRHSGSLPLAAMGHNWLLVDPAKFNDANNAAISAGVANHYLPKDRSLFIAGSTVLLGGGTGEPHAEKIPVDTSKLTKGKAYKYFCSFPGHFAMMSGELVLQ